MTTSKQYDYLNRLGSIASTPSNSFTYAPLDDFKDYLR
jgi:hypothetical protein